MQRMQSPRVENVNDSENDSDTREEASPRKWEAMGVDLLIIGNGLLRQNGKRLGRVFTMIIRM